MRINKSEFIELIAGRLGLTYSSVERFLEAHNQIIFEYVKTDNKVTTGLGQFSRSHRKARIGVNPRQPDQKITIPALVTPKFKASDTFKQAIK
jgi:DNA-binding protein HU-beta